MTKGALLEKEKRDNTWLAFIVLGAGILASILLGGMAYPAIFGLIIALALLYQA